MSGVEQSRAVGRSGYRGAAVPRLIVLGVMACAALPALAMRHLTVAQLEKVLTASAARHRADADMVREFGDFDLTERLTDATRERIAATLHTGPQTTLALQLLADESAVLDPPANERAGNPAPDADAQARMIAAATAYVTETLPHLPDLLATRTTYTFNDTAQIFKVNEWPVRAGLHLVSKTSQEITYLDDRGVASGSTPAGGAPSADGGHTIKASASAAPANRPTERGLQSYGEFGQLLGVIFVDTRKSAPVFHHWEQTSAGLVAVYRYAVPKAESHYAVNYCCLFDGLRTNTRRGGGRRGGSVAGDVQTKATIPFHKVPAYHGSLFINPETGVIRRVTLEAEMGDSPVSRAATVIEYGQVVIGERRFICPLRSMNIYEGPAESGPPASALPVTTPRSLEATGTLYVNETSFNNYHRLGSTVRVLPEGETPPAAPAEEPEPKPRF